MTELPKGWAATTLGELGHYWNGRGFKKSEWRPEGQGRPIIRIQDLTGSNQKPNYFDGEADDRNVARPGDILVSWAATLGVFEWRGPEAVINQHIFKVVSFIEQRFHRYLIESVLDDLRGRSHGTGMVHVTRGVFDETPVWLPPLTEQARIVAAIEEQVSRLDDAEAALRAAIRRQRRLRATAVSLALSGDWPIKQLRDVTLEQVYGSSAKATAGLHNGVPIVRMGNICDGRVDLSRGVKYLPREHPDVERYTLHPGDLLFNRTNSPELVGKSGVFTGAAGEACFASYLIRVRLGEGCLPEWAALYLNGPQGRRWAAAVRTQQVGQANINGTKLASLPLPLPPVEEQRSRIAELDRQFSILDSLTTALDQALTRSEQLRRGILNHAFSGRLVPQISSDEPASQMLARIAGRWDANRSGRGRRSSVDTVRI